MNKKVKVRFAPSPTGPLHIGGVRTALFNYLFAKKHGGEFLLRIEDTDQNRFVAGSEKYIIDSLAWLGISPDWGVNPDGTATYRQSERGFYYRSFAEKLIEKGYAYYAFDTPEEIDAMKKTFEAAGVYNPGYTNVTRGTMVNSFTLSADELKSKLDAGIPHVIRFNSPVNKTIEFTDSVKGPMSLNSSAMDDKVLFKSDGLPTYHLANIVDDHLMEITHVIRGDEWLPSTSLHIMLYEAFGWDIPIFCHLPLILGPDGKKLSKRHGDKYGFPVFPMTWDYVDEKGGEVHITGFKDEDYEPDALLNFIALLGWNPGGDKEIMTMDEMISLFDLDRVNSSGAMFDVEKLKSFNSIYLKNIDRNILWKNSIVSNFINAKEVCRIALSESAVDKIIDIAKDRSTFKKDLYKSVSYFFEPVILKDDVVLKNDSEFRNIITHFISNPCNRVIWTMDGIKSTLDGLCDLNNIKLGKILPDLRLALTGGAPGPDLQLIMEILGPDESVKRIENLLNKTKKVAS